MAPTGNNSPELRLEVKITPGQLSVAVAVDHVTNAPHLPASFVLLMFAGVFRITGNSLSATVTVKLQVAVPHMLVAVIVTVVIPLLNIDPLPLPVPLPVVAPLNV